jgi:hypothetical protein
MKKRLSILLMLALMFSSMSIGVFAADDVNTNPDNDSTDIVLQDDDVVSDADQLNDVTDDDTAVTAQNVDTQTMDDPNPDQDQDPDPELPVPVNTLNAYSGYKGVALEWAPTGADSYNVYRNGSCIARNVITKAYDNAGMMAYFDKTGDETGAENSYYVTAVKSGTESNPSPTISKGGVCPLYIKVTFNRTRTLKSHDKAHKKRTFKKGFTVKTYDFRFGKYIFMYKGNRFFVNYMSLRGHKALLNKNHKYSDKEAEYFVNTTGKSSSTGIVIWANLYTQRLYILKGSKGNFRVSDLSYKGTKAHSWIISSGKPTSPSPTGLNHTIKRKKTTQRGVKWLSFYHSQTSLHGKVGNQGFNTLRSGGCIRNPDKYSQLIYKKCPKKTRVMVY